MYAKQKGADLKMIKDLDNGLKNFASVILKTSGKNIDPIPGAGAAGGLGGGFLAFLKGADLVITGEGKLNKQTGMGKSPSVF